MDKGSIHIYCGEGKGKTTAAIGQGIQEASQGRSVIIIQFMKERNAAAGAGDQTVPIPEIGRGI